MAVAEAVLEKRIETTFKEESFSEPTAGGIIAGVFVLLFFLAAFGLVWATLHFTTTPVDVVPALEGVLEKATTVVQGSWHSVALQARAKEVYRNLTAFEEKGWIEQARNQAFLLTCLKVADEAEALGLRLYQLTLDGTTGHLNTRYDPPTIQVTNNRGIVGRYDVLNIADTGTLTLPPSAIGVLAKSEALVSKVGSGVITRRNFLVSRAVADPMIVIEVKEDGHSAWFSIYQWENAFNNITMGTAE